MGKRRARRNRKTRKNSEYTTKAQSDFWSRQERLDELRIHYCLGGVLVYILTIPMFSGMVHSLGPALEIIFSILYVITVLYVMVQLLLPFMANFIDDETMCKWSLYYRKLCKQDSAITKE